MEAITISNDLLTIGTNSFNAGNYIALAEGSTVVIVHNSSSRDRIFEALFSNIKLNNVRYATAAELCTAFNALAAAALRANIESMSGNIADLKDNTGYPENLISAVLTPNDATPITNQALSGSVILTTPAANTGVIYVGLAGVDNTKYAMEADKSIAIELSDLSRICVKNSVAGEKVHVIGSCKSA
jgi:hypothetical protein